MSTADPNRETSSRQQTAAESEEKPSESLGPLITEADVVVTTSHSPNDDVIEHARTIAADLGGPFSLRSDKSLEDIRAATGRQHLID